MYRNAGRGYASADPIEPLMEFAERTTLVASTRTGSTWLSSLLDSHPEIRFHGELFNLERAPVAALHDPRAYLNDRLAGGGSHRVVGFKLLYHQARLSYLNEFLFEMEQGRKSEVDWRTIFPARPVTREHVPALAKTWELIRSGGGRIIHLRRRNLLRQRLSHEMMMAESRARWSSEPAAGPMRIRLATDRLIQSFAEATAAAVEIDCFFAGNQKLTVFYEDLTADVAAQCGTILRFLGVRIASLVSAKKKSERRALCETIENFGEVEHALAGTPWEQFLDDCSAHERRNPLRCD